MDWAHLVAFNLTLLAAIVTPGPALLYALRVSLVEGRAAGVLTGIGLGLVAAMWTALALLGLDRLFVLVPWAYGAAKIAGALYLIWIAWGTWRAARRPIPHAAEAPRLGRAVLRGAALNLANPKSVLFAAAVLVVIFPGNLSPVAMGIVVLNHLAVEIAFYTAFATLLSRPAARSAYLGAKPVLDRIAGMVMGALGIRLLLDRG